MIIDKKIIDSIARLLGLEFSRNPFANLTNIKNKVDQLFGELSEVDIKDKEV